MKRALVLCLAIAMFMFAFTGQIADSQFKADIQFKPPRFKVNVSVSVKDELTKSFIESHIKRELRSLRDPIDVVPFSEALYFLRLTVVESSYLTGGKTGDISIATCYFMRSQTPDFMINPDHKEAWKTLYANTTFTEPTLLCHQYPKGRWEEACKSIVASFDQNLLEKTRILLDMAR